jgi:hypothetical protein
VTPEVGGVFSRSIVASMDATPLTPDQRRERTRRIRKRIHEAMPGCVAVVDHIDFVGAYVYQEDLEEAKKVIGAVECEGATVQVRVAPPLRS